MIVETYKGNRYRPVLHSILPPPSVPKQTQQNWPYPTKTNNEPRPNEDDKRRAKQFEVDPEEFVRRDKIVRQMWVDCGFKAGEMCRPFSNEQFEKYGRCTIRGVFKSYHDFSTAEGKDWPADDKPFIITCEPDKKADNTRMLLVVPGWLTRFYPK